MQSSACATSAQLSHCIASVRGIAAAIMSVMDTRARRARSNASLRCNKNACLRRELRSLTGARHARASRSTHQRGASCHTRRCREHGGAAARSRVRWPTRLLQTERLSPTDGGANFTAKPSACDRPGPPEDPESDRLMCHRRSRLLLLSRASSMSSRTSSDLRRPLRLAASSKKVCTVPV